MEQMQQYMNQLTLLACIINHKMSQVIKSKSAALKNLYDIANALAEQLIIFDELLDEYSTWLIMANEYAKTVEMRMNSYMQLLQCFTYIDITS